MAGGYYFEGMTYYGSAEYYPRIVDIGFGRRIAKCRHQSRIVRGQSCTSCNYVRCVRLIRIRGNAHDQVAVITPTLPYGQDRRVIGQPYP